MMKKLTFIFIFFFTLSSCESISSYLHPSILSLTRVCEDELCSQTDIDYYNQKVQNFFNTNSSNVTINYRVLQQVTHKKYLIKFFPQGQVYLLVLKNPANYTNESLIKNSGFFKVTGTYTYSNIEGSTNTVGIIIETEDKINLNTNH